MAPIMPTKPNAAELHVVSVEELPSLSVSIDDIREACSGAPLP